MLTREGQKHGYIGHPVDIWSTGVTLFAMICGFLPFEHRDTGALYKKIIAGDYVTPPFLSRDAKDIMKRLLTTDPHRRWSLAQIAEHPWCTAGGAAQSVISSGSPSAGAVAQLAYEVRLLHIAHHAPLPRVLSKSCRVPILARADQRRSYDARVHGAETRLRG